MTFVRWKLRVMFHSWKNVLLFSGHNGPFCLLSAPSGSHTYTATNRKVALETSIANKRRPRNESLNFGILCFGKLFKWGTALARQTLLFSAQQQEQRNCSLRSTLKLWAANAKMEPRRERKRCKILWCQLCSWSAVACYAFFKSGGEVRQVKNT